MSTEQRRASIQRETIETKIDLQISLDGRGESRIETGIGMLDHLLTSLARHSSIDINLSCQGDTHVDDHHTAEDCGLALGQAIDQALGKRAGIIRFGFAYAPLDEALVRAVIDLSGRPGAWIDLPMHGGRLGELRCENVPHILSSTAVAMRATLHVDGIKGANDHHVAEAAFKAFALALRSAVARTKLSEVPSTKGTL